MDEVILPVAVAIVWLRARVIAQCSCESVKMSLSVLACAVPKMTVKFGPAKTRPARPLATAM